MFEPLRFACTRLIHLATKPKRPSDHANSRLSNHTPVSFIAAAHQSIDGGGWKVKGFNCDLQRLCLQFAFSPGAEVC